ncbi:FAS1 domain-containing protein [Karstenula rhodostoma CBS 690.94]|uniref:FAS1 domain-containing protein n=1 Tax=Karstenula rhodostoma CBS 690.94 TaxID=1392251 RepID=A0A9P4U5S2_9PLEO|nr:FAS1 domain-containing protein [Karstenula rhodostoma CBS 690.94]
MRTSLALTAYISAVLAQAPSLTDLIASQPNLSTLGTALGSLPDLVKTLAGLSNITILAPTNSAFEALLAGDATPESTAVNSSDAQGIAAILAYHVLNGTYVSSDFSETPAFAHTFFVPSFEGRIRTNVTDGQNVGLVLDGENATILSGELKSANVIEADIQAANGVVIHKIDTVLTPPRNASTTLSTASSANVTSILTALTTANLVSPIDTTPDLTLFVPNDAAFAAASALANASTDALTAALTYHAIAGAVLFSTAITNTTLKTVNGADLALAVGQDGAIYIDNAKVLRPNILLSNGVAHIIDAVLTPETETSNPGNGTSTGASVPSPTASEFPGAAARVKGAAPRAFY